MKSSMAGLGYQTQEGQGASSALLAELEAKDQEIQSLKDLVEAQSELQSADVQNAKIIDLAKKNRNLNLALERERQKVIKLQQDLVDCSAPRLQNGGVASHSEKLEAVARSMVEQAAEAAEAAHKELAILKDKLQQTSNKLCQVEQKAVGLESENKKLVRVLMREVGEEVPLAKLLEESSDWKGRREQIISLKDQIRQLKAAQGLVTDSRVEAANKNKIREKAAERSAEHERVAADLAAARQEIDNLRLKHDGAVSRRKILEGEVHNLKEKLAVVLDKTKNDDKLIAALRTEIGRNRQKDAGAEPLTSAVNDAVWNELSALRAKCSEQAAAIDKQQEIILALQAALPTDAST